jgi:hypothetical protein
LSILKQLAEPDIIYNTFIYTIKNEINVPSGEITSASDMRYDFTQPKLIAKDIDLLQADIAYDINYVLDKDISDPAQAA